MYKSPDAKKRVLNCLKLIPFAVCFVLIVLCIVNRDKLTVENILHYTPKNLYLASLALVGMYAAKSIAVFFPLLVLNIVGGMLFPPVPALIVNTVGICVMTAIPYCIGVFSGSEIMEKFGRKYPLIEKSFKKLHDDEFFLAFFLRIISCLPGDIVSMYFGAAKVPFGKYFIGSILGIIPGVITATFMGASIMNPLSKTFIISLLMTILLSVFSVVIHLVRKVIRGKNSREQHF